MNTTWPAPGLVGSVTGFDQCAPPSVDLYTQVPATLERNPLPEALTTSVAPKLLTTPAPKANPSGTLWKPAGSDSAVQDHVCPPSVER